LRHTGWTGEPIPFGASVAFTCERGTAFEEDYDQESVQYACQDGSEPGTERGYFKVPADGEWPLCVAGQSVTLE
jgi:hypothetical protein